MDINNLNITGSMAVVKDEQGEGTVVVKKQKELGEFMNTVLSTVIDTLTITPKRSNEKEVRALEEQINAVQSALAQKQGRHLFVEEKKIVSQYVMNEIIGYGPITPLLDDPTVSEVMVNGYNNIYVERKGKLQKTDVRFNNNPHVLHTIDKILAPIGRRVDESSPMVDARLSDGSRVNIIIPPLSLKGPIVTIRKFAADPYGLEDLINFGTLDMNIAKFLIASVRGRCNIIVAGGTGSGKTTLLNVISGFISKDERIVTIENAAELQLQQDHVITLESRGTNIEGKGEVSIRDLVVNTLRMRPDRIIVGEVRSGETLDMLQAMNTGHDGSITTAHANSTRDTLRRLETMVMMAGMDLPSKAIREQIASAIDLIVQVSRLNDGSRKIVCISEVMGMEGETIILQDIFTFEQEGFDDKNRVLGHFEPTGVVPSFMDKLRNHGENLPTTIFHKQ